MGRTIQLFITCLLDTFYPQTGEAVVRVLQRMGVAVEFPPGQTCCGQPAFNAGLRKQALPLAMHTLRTFEQTSGPLVIPSGSCAAMLRHGYLELFAGQPQWLRRAQALAERTFELTEFLVDQLGVSDLGASFLGRLAYHPSCHLLTGLGVDPQPRQLLKGLRQAEIVELPSTNDCCGFGGIFSAEHPELSTAMLERKIANIEKSGADWVAVCDAGCITHINGGCRRLGKKPRMLHIAHLLLGRETHAG